MARRALAAARLAALATIVLLSTTGSASFAKAKAGKSKKSSKAAASKAGGGFGKAVVATGPTAAQLLKSSMEQYDLLEKLQNQQNSAEAEAEYGEGSDDASADEAAAAKPAESTGTSVSVTKWCIALRSSNAAEFSDWVPAALLALGCGESTPDPRGTLPTALGACVKEVIEGCAQAQPALRKVARETVEYSFEPLDSFETHVYEGLQGRAERRTDAAATLGIEPGASAGEVKKAHRKLMMELHPDRFVGDEDGAAAAEKRMLEVQEAYGELGGGLGGGSGSFYASIGGKARVSFSGALVKEAMAPLGKPRPQQEQPFEDGGWRVGITPMATTVTREFVTRNLMRSSKDDD